MTLRNLRSILIGCTLLLLAACAVFQLPTAPVKFSNGVLVNNAGMTLYTYDKDSRGKSNCTGQCATNWPPLKATASDKAGGYYSLVTRDDGSLQWAYDGMPLYLWVKDQKPGDKTGDGVNKVWHVVSEPVMDNSGGGY
ncbi:MAG TPA: hypothetical protein VFW00_05875 [Rhodocyclaceae bacterium]|nr:hypothetical protein [Rhodocyclaceae bacterium]